MVQCSLCLQTFDTQGGLIRHELFNKRHKRKVSELSGPVSDGAVLFHSPAARTAVESHQSAHLDTQSYQPAESPDNNADEPATTCHNFDTFDGLQAREASDSYLRQLELRLQNACADDDTSLARDLVPWLVQRHSSKLSETIQPHHSISLQGKVTSHMTWGCCRAGTARFLSDAGCSWLACGLA